MSDGSSSAIYHSNLNVCLLHYRGPNAYILPKWTGYRPLISYTHLTQINLANIEKPWLCVILIYCFGLLGKNTETRNMIYFCVAPFAILVAPTHFYKNPLNVNRANTHLCAYRQTHRHIMHKKKNIKTLEGSGLVSGSCFIRYLRNLGHMSIWRKAKQKRKRETNHFHKRQAVTFPSERGYLRWSTFTVLPTTQQLCPNLLWSQLELLMTQ